MHCTQDSLGPQSHETGWLDWRLQERWPLEVGGRHPLELHQVGLLLRRLHARQRRGQPEVCGHELRDTQVRDWILG